MGADVIDELERMKQISLLNTKSVLNMDDVALLTGLSKHFLYRLCSKRQLPHYKQGKKISFFKKNEIENWMLSNRIPTADEITAEKGGVPC